jgi:penicillin-binding protein 2
VTPVGLPAPEHKKSRGIDPVKLRLSVLAMVVVGAFVALFSRLWFLQVLAADEFKQVAQQTRERRIESEPIRGRILDRNGNELVINQRSWTISMRRSVLENKPKRDRVLKRLSKVLKLPVKEMKKQLKDVRVSPYKPAAVATDVPEDEARFIDLYPNRFPGVEVEKLPVRNVLAGYVAPHVLGYTNEINEEELKSKEWRGYGLGDVIGKAGVERTYDRYLRGRPGVTRVVVDAAGDVVGKRGEDRALVPGADLKLTISSRIQHITQKALASGIAAAKGAGYEAPSGAVVVMDPRNGDVLAMASYPFYDARPLADGISIKEYRELGALSEKDPTDDALLNRAIQTPLAPGSTFKPITSWAAMATGVAGPYDYVSCPGTAVLPPGPSGFPFPNWTDADLPSMSFPQAIEVSCNTVFYQLGWRMEDRFGPEPYGDGSFRFQKLARLTGFGRETGVDLPYENSGIIPNPQTCKQLGTCDDGWLPGFTINMAVGQGDLLVTPMQMATAYSAIVNGGDVYRPRIASALVREEVTGEQRVVRKFEPEVDNRLPVGDLELSVIRQGMEAVVGSGGGTASAAFGGFPLTAFPVGGKTGTAQIGESQASNAWFISYAPTDAPRYVVATFVEKAGHGGESAAPIARQIYEGIFEGDKQTSVTLGTDESD